MEVVYNKNKIGLECLMISVYFIAMPFSLVGSGAGGSILKLLAFPIAGYCLVSLFIGNVRVNFNTVHLFWALYVLYQVFSLVYLYNPQAWENVRGMLQIFVLSAVMSARVFNQKEYTVFKISFLVMGGIVILASFFSAEVMVEGRKTIRFFGYYCDPNELCGYVMVPLLLCLEAIMGNKKYKVFYIVYAFLTVYVILLTGSRGGLIAMIGMVTIYVFLSVKGVGKKIAAVVIIILFALIVVFVVYPLLPADLQARFSVERVVEDKGSGRFDIWNALIESFKSSEQNIYFGQGVSSVANVLTSQGFTNNVAHNTIIQTLHDLGIVGLILFMGMIVAGVVRNRNVNDAVSISLIGMMALSMSLTFDPSMKIFWNTVMFASFSYGE